MCCPGKKAAWPLSWLIVFNCLILSPMTCDQAIDAHFEGRMDKVRLLSDNCLPFYRIGQSRSRYVPRGSICTSVTVDLSEIQFQGPRWHEPACLARSVGGTKDFTSRDFHLSEDYGTTKARRCSSRLLLPVPHGSSRFKVKNLCLNNDP